MQLNVNVYLHLSNSASFPIYKKLNIWYSEMVCLVDFRCLLVVCSRLVVICGGLLVVCGVLLVFCGGLRSFTAGLQLFVGGL